MLTVTVHSRSVSERGWEGCPGFQLLRQGWLDVRLGPPITSRLPGWPCSRDSIFLIREVEQRHGLGWAFLSPDVPYSLVALPRCPEYGAVRLNPFGY